MIRKERKKQRIVERTFKLIGIILTIVVIAMSMYVGLIAKDIKVVPTKFIIIGCVVYIAGAIVIAIITVATKRWQWNILSIIIFSVFLSSSILLYRQLDFTRSTLEKNAGIRVETSQISVYVMRDDSAEVIADTKNYTFAILRELDRESTDETVSKINEKLAADIITLEYEEITDLADAMMDGEAQVLILNDSYYDVLLEWNNMLEECEIPIESRDYESFAKNLRKLEQFEIEKVIEISENNDYITEIETEAAETFEYVNTDCFIMYISGQDAWGGVSGRSRSDVNILAIVNTNTHKVMLISTPRDYYVPLSVSGGVRDKLTHAGIYGIDCSRDTLEMLYGYNIDYYFKLNFSGFEAIIDALGGITVWSDYDFTVDPVKHYVKGDNYLTGLEALAFARERYALPGGDNARGHNQMNVIISVVDKMCSSALLNNYTGVLNSLDGMYITDMPYDVMASIIRDQIDAGQGWDIRSYAVTGAGASASTYTMGSTQLYVMEPNMESVEEAKRLVQATMDGILE